VILVSFLLTLTYLIYGILENTYLVYIPNSIGIFLNICAIGVYLSLRRKMRKFEENSLLKKLNMEAPDLDFD